MPAVSDMAPPAPVLPSPTVKVMSPPLPPTALPVLIAMLPLAPAVGESPVASSILPLLPVVPPAPVFMDTSQPLLPDVPPAAVDSVIAPLSAAVPTPVVIVTAPPVPAAKARHNLNLATSAGARGRWTCVDGSSDVTSLMATAPVALLDRGGFASRQRHGAARAGVAIAHLNRLMSPPLPPTALPVLIEMLPLAPAVWESPVASSMLAAVAGGAATSRSSWTRRRCCQMCHLQRSTASSRRCRLRCQHLS